MPTEREKIRIIEQMGIRIHRILSNGEVQCECPLHTDNDPSLMINVRTDKFQCFSGCIKGRTFEDLVKKISGKDMDFSDPKEWSNMFKSKLYPKTKFEQVPTIPNLPLAIGNDGEKYLLSDKRKLTPEIIKEFGVLFWTSKNAVVVPIEKIGYMVRYIDRKEFKYITGTKINDCLFGQSRLFVNVLKYIILVEGSFDVMYLHKLGYKNAVAIMHGDISEAQKNVLNWFQLPVYVMMDNDPEGQKIADRIMKKLKGEFRVKNILLPEGKDPTDCQPSDIYGILGE